MAARPVIRSWNADQDLLAIWRHIAGHSPAAADRMLRRFDRAISQLGAHPDLGERQPRVGDEVRRIIVGRYLVFYEVREDSIFVIRILHSARDWENHL